MMNIPLGHYLICIITFIFSIDLLGQNLHDSLYNAMPLEVYDGFEHDSFTLLGETKPRKVYKVGVYQSNVKIHLDEVGEVFVHHVIAFMEEGHPYMEIYSRQPSSGFIQGIRRYGHYRMYVRQAFKAEDRYNGDSRIEFVNGLNTIVRSINPRTVFDINAGKEMLWEEDNGELTRVSFNLSDCRRYVDTMLYDISIYKGLKAGCPFSGFIEYGFSNELVQLSLHAGIGSEEPTGLETYESVFYDTVGHVVLRLSESGPIGSVYLTVDRKYVYMSGGGALTEDFIAPYTFKIAKLDSGKVLLERKSKDLRHSGFIISGTNLGVYEVQKEYGANALLEAYIIDHDKNLMYLIHQSALCQPPFFVLYYKDYCECRKPNGLKTKLSYDKDFTAVAFIKK